MTEAETPTPAAPAEQTVPREQTALPEQTALREQLDAIITESGAGAQRTLVRRILEAGIGLGQDGTARRDLKITAAAVEEMRAAFQLFAPYAGSPKVTIFGSARTQSLDPLWEQAHTAAEELAEQGWFVVTGAGPGIMEAAATGAGPEQSLGVSIRLPFEESPNAVLADDGRQVAMKYFFTRKLMLVKESSGFICLPGGFGTMDETFELLTLQQTGKMDPVPIVLLDRAGGQFWRGFAAFVTEQLAANGLVSVDDLDRVLVTDSVDAAVAEVTGFWRNYDSLRWFDAELVLRLKAAPSDAELAHLNAHFSGLCETGRIERAEARPEERGEEDRPELPRLVLTPRRRAVGELHRLIRALNELPSAPQG